MFSLPVDCTTASQSQFIGVARGRAGGPGPPIEMLPMIKMSQKRLLLLQFQFLLVSSRTRVITNNIDPGGLGSLNLIFTNQLK